MCVVECQHDAFGLVEAAWEAQGRLADHEVGQHLARQIAKRLFPKEYATFRKEYVSKRYETE